VSEVAAKIFSKAVLWVRGSYIENTAISPSYTVPKVGILKEPVSPRGMIRRR